MTLIRSLLPLALILPSVLAESNLDDAPLGFGLVCFAGSATMVGAAIVFMPASVIEKLGGGTFLAWCLSLAAGVMLYVSFIEIFSKSTGAFTDAGENEDDAYVYGTLSFFGGILINFLLGKLTDMLDDDDEEDAEEVQTATQKDEEKGANSESANGTGAPQGEPDYEQAVKGTVDTINAAGHGHSHMKVSDVTSKVPDEKKEENEEKKKKHLMKMGVKTAIAIGLHNFPEGLATFVGTLDDPSVGASLAVAIAVHNVPEGICVAMPVYHATGSQWKAFMWAAISGISEPIGAGLGWIVLYNTMDDYVYGAVFGIVGGMMVHISVKELLPMALAYDTKNEIVAHGVVIGFAIMALSLCLFLY